MQHDRCVRERKVVFLNLLESRVTASKQTIRIQSIKQSYRLVFTSVTVLSFQLVHFTYVRILPQLKASFYNLCHLGLLFVLLLQVYKPVSQTGRPAVKDIALQWSTHCLDCTVLKQSLCTVTTLSLRTITMRFPL